MSKVSRPKIIVVAGPTGTGKTDLAVRLAKRVSGVIINADSRQVYKGMGIGTNKGTLGKTGRSLMIAEKSIDEFEIDGSGVNGWLFDLVDPGENFSIADYQQLTVGLITELHSRGEVPILVGGSGLYIDIVLKGYALSGAPANESLREALSKLSQTELFAMLGEVNPAKADALNNSDRNNPVRLIRAIEKMGVDAQDSSQKELKSGYDAYMIYPEFDREELYQRLNLRVDKMIAAGWVEEVKGLVERGLKDARPLQGVGYGELIAQLSGDLSLEEAVQKIKQGHRNYAARQITWFEGEGRGYYLHRYDFEKDGETITNDVRTFLIE
ncbi:MAG: tRNA (adenosine(37)-N6)-dimethylallyltransferase MiaA [Candidatus Dojkabacteria bacterium]